MKNVLLLSVWGSPAGTAYLKELLKIPKQFRSAILREIRSMEKLLHPLEHRNARKLEGRNTKDYRLRVGDYRVKFSLEKDGTAVITHVQHRQAGY